jgi:hypothetical protein
VTASGLELYLANCFPEYEDKVKELVALIVNKEVWASDLLARAASIPRKVAHHMLSELEMHGHLQLSKNIGLTAQINSTSVSLKRLLTG